MQAQGWIERRKHSRVVQVTAAGAAALDALGLAGFGVQQAGAAPSPPRGRTASHAAAR